MRGVAILVAFYLAGVGLESGLHLPLPANIVGLLLLLAAFHAKLMKPEWVDASARLGLRHMGLFFIPAIAGASDLLPQLRSQWLSVGIGLVAGTLLTMASTGLVVLLWRGKERKPDARL